MSTELESRISGDACDLLACFSSGLADAVRGIAEDIAKERALGTQGPIQIEAGDVRKAGEFVLEYLRRAIQKGVVS